MQRDAVCQVRRVGGRLRAIDVAGGGEALSLDGLPPEGSWVGVRPNGTYRILAGAGSRRADLLQLVVKSGVHPLHPTEAHHEAQAFVEDLALEGLPDLRHLPFVPIDEVTSRDLDQAVAIERRGDGFVVWYALADAAHFVRPGSALYEGSLERGATYYLPELVVPMLPRLLSEDLISLNAGVDRRAMVFELTLDADGRCVERSIHRARVHCRHKLDFGSVQRFLEGEAVDWDDDVQESLRLLEVVGRLRIARADERGVIRYRRAEVDVHLHGLRFVAMVGPRNDVERYNEQISLLTNIEGARFLLEGDGEEHVQAIYRVHDAPSSRRIVELAALTEEVARLHGLSEDWIWRPSESTLSDYLDRLPHGPVAAALHRQAMIVNRPGVFAADPGQHHGVGAEIYGRFTAPMREVVGIFLHHEVWERLAGRRLHPAHGTDLRDRVVEVSNVCRERQRKLNREVNRMVLDDLFRMDLTSGRRPRRGVVMGMTPSRVHVQLLQPRVDVKVYVAHIERHVDRELEVIEGASLRAADGEVWLRVGDTVDVSVIGRDERRDRWNLAVSPRESGDDA